MRHNVRTVTIMFLLVLITGFTQKVFAQDSNSTANASANVVAGDVTSTTTVTQGGATASVGSQTTNTSVGGHASEQNLNQTFEAGNAPRIPDPAITIIPPNSPLPQIGFPLPPFSGPVKGDPNVPAKDAAEGFTQILSLPHLKDGFTREDARRVVGQIEKKEGFFRVKRRIPAMHIIYRKNLPLAEPGEEVKHQLDVVPDLSQWETGMLVGMGEAEEFLPIDALSMKAFLEIPKEYCVTHLLFLPGGILYTKSTSEAAGLVLGGGTVGGATPGAHVLTGVIGKGSIEGSTHTRYKSRVRAYAYCLRGPKGAPSISSTISEEENLRKALDETQRSLRLREEEILEKQAAMELLIVPESSERLEFGYNETSPLPGQEVKIMAMADWIIHHAEAVETLKGTFTTFGLSDQCGEFKINDFFAAERAQSLQKLLLAELAGRGRSDIQIRTASEGERWIAVKKTDAHPGCKEAKNRIAVVRYVGAMSSH